MFGSAFWLKRVMMPFRSFTRLAACRAALLCAVLACSCLVQLTAAQFGMPGMGMDKPPKAAAVKSDVQYIKCQACEALVKQAYRHTKSKREGLKPGQKVGTPGVCAASYQDWMWVYAIIILQLVGCLQLLPAGQTSASTPSRGLSCCPHPLTAASAPPSSSALPASFAFLPVLAVLQLEESAIIDHLEAMCDPSKPEGQWITNYDIVEKGKELKLVDTGKV